MNQFDKYNDNKASYSNSNNSNIPQKMTKEQYEQYKMNKRRIASKKKDEQWIDKIIRLEDSVEYQGSSITYHQDQGYTLTLTTASDILVAVQPFCNFPKTMDTGQWTSYSTGDILSHIRILANIFKFAVTYDESIETHNNEAYKVGVASLVFNNTQISSKVMMRYSSRREATYTYVTDQPPFCPAGQARTPAGQARTQEVRVTVRDNNEDDSTKLKLAQYEGANITYLYKYALMRLFAIDDKDHDDFDAIRAQNARKDYYIVEEEPDEIDIALQNSKKAIEEDKL